MYAMNDRERQALEQIQAIVDSLGSDSPLADAIQRAYKELNAEPAADSVKVSLPEETVRQWEAEASRGGNV